MQVPNDVRDIITKLHPETKRKVRAAVDAIAEDPATGELLEQDLTGLRRIRVGSWRMAYRVDANVIRIHAVGRRATVYSDLIAQLRRAARERSAPYRRRATAAARRARPD